MDAGGQLALMFLEGKILKVATFTRGVAYSKIILENVELSIGSGYT